MVYCRNCQVLSGFVAETALDFQNLFSARFSVLGQTHDLNMAIFVNVELYIVIRTQRLDLRALTPNEIRDNRRVYIKCFNMARPNCVIPRQLNNTRYNFSCGIDSILRTREHHGVAVLNFNIDIFMTANYLVKKLFSFGASRSHQIRTLYFNALFDNIFSEVHEGCQLSEGVVYVASHIELLWRKIIIGLSIEQIKLIRGTQDTTNGALQSPDLLGSLFFHHRESHASDYSQ